MTERNNGIKNLIEAHGWLGVIISVVLFIVFWAGSVSFFLPEIEHWAAAPGSPVDTGKADMSRQALVERHLATLPADPEGHLTLYPATRDYPYHHLAIDLKPSAESAHPEVAYRVDPKTGESLGAVDQFHLADFLYTLHYNLNLPGGSYLVGLVTLLFLVLVITGVWIHGRKIFRHFFMYRRERQRNKLLDLHNLVGVMTLPFSAMYAVTGLIFNLAIVYQLAFAVFLYDGDQEALLRDAGYGSPTVTASEKRLAMDRAWTLVEQVESDAGGPATMIRFDHYGSANATATIVGRRKDRFADFYEYTYRIDNGELLKDVRDSNTLRQGLDVVTALHFGDFAGLDLRFLYFALGLAVAGMIVAGNLLWLDKRALQGNVGPFGQHLVRGMTLGGCGGAVLATAAGFLAERVLPLGIAARGQWLGYLFAGVFVITLVVGLLCRRQPRSVIARGLQLTAGLLLLTVAADWVLFGQGMLTLWRQGASGVIGVELGLVLLALLAFQGARVLRRSASRPRDPVV